MSEVVIKKCIHSIEEPSYPSPTVFNLTEGEEFEYEVTLPVPFIAGTLTMKLGSTIAVTDLCGVEKTVKFIFSDLPVRILNGYIEYNSGNELIKSSKRITVNVKSVTPEPEPEEKYKLSIIFKSEAQELGRIERYLSHGEKYSFSVPRYEGYTPSVNVVSGTMPRRDYLKNVYYMKVVDSLDSPEVPTPPTPPTPTLEPTPL